MSETNKTDYFHPELWQDPNVYSIFVTDNIPNYGALEAGGIVSSCMELDDKYDINKWLNRMELLPNRQDKTYIFVFDRDTEENRKLLKMTTQELQYQDIRYAVPGQDVINADNLFDAVISDKEIFEKLKEFQNHLDREQKPRPDSAAEYLRISFDKELKEFQQGVGKKTGFPELDRNAGGIYPGLYVLGGISSVGKTTFAHQLADQIARAGEDVLYFSLEQSRLEMISKSIARETAKLTSKDRLTSLQIRQGQTNDDSTRAKEKYLEQIAERLSIVEGGFHTTIKEIGGYIRGYVEKNNCRPIVFIDYLQIIQPAPDSTGRKLTDQRAITDNNVTTLKRISRKYKLPIFVISSLNRANYLSEIDFESFKESGGIEYTADVVYGMQLAAIHESIFDKQNNINEKRNRIKEAKGELPRKVELVCLKNRFGRSGFTVNFNYNPQWDLFTEEPAPAPRTAAKWI